MNFRNYLLLLIFSLSACVVPSSDSEESTAKPLFTKLSADSTNIDFENHLDYNAEFNIYTYRNFYNGGGVGLGDFNNDGLLDVYFTANMTTNRLYLNRGDFKFEDITEQSGAGGTRGWSTGVSVVDVNGDGRSDIYVCNSGDLQGDNKQNELFINEGWDSKTGVVTFSEQAEAYGLADQGYSTHAAFFDYDRDGDLDVYLLNNSYQAIGSFNLRKNMRPVRDEVGGDKLFRNDGKYNSTTEQIKFTDVSEEAGIYGSVIGFGLGVTVGDIDQDGWQDIYVSNDFFERDYIYMNNGDGTFREELENQMRSISGASMGADMADINNDGYSDIFVTEMLPGQNERLKTKTTFENWDKYQYNLKNGYYHQFTRNMLHLNNSDGTFSEIGRLAGVEATDWSWGALIYDMDNDGFKDVFVANGIYQDLTDQDYINFISNEETLKSMINGKKVDYQRLIDSIPSEPIANYAFHNDGGKNQAYTFSDKAAAWGLDTPGHSNGSAYGDFDNDGDMDLIVNNVNSEAFVYRNETSQVTENNFLKIKLQGEGGNTYAIGTKLKAYANGQQFFLEQMPVRGFESTVDPRPNFGLGTIEKLDSLLIIWPDDTYLLMKDVKTNGVLGLFQYGAKSGRDFYEKTNKPTTFKEVTKELNLKAEHIENDFVDFDIDRLIYHMLSTEGPKIAKADVNGDGLEDFYIGGAKETSGALWIQNRQGKFSQSNEALFEADKDSEDVDGLFFDADQDGDQDLYVASGGNEFSSSSSPLKDRLYFNDGKGVFTKSNQLLPAGKYESSSCVRAADFDQDGDQDLFVGIRLRPRLYGVPANGYLLENDGKGNFKSVSQIIAPDLKEVGMITDAQWADMDGDQDMDLIIVGEWMPITWFENKGGTFSAKKQIPNSSGWWNTIERADLDGDGDLDFVLGNHGLNSRFCATRERPVEMYINDFDQNRTVEQIVSCYEGEQTYPMVLRHDLVMQLPALKKKYLKYASYKNVTVQDIFTPKQLEKAIVNQVTTLESAVLLNGGDGTFVLKSLPLNAQLAPVYAILVKDVNEDGHLDVLLGGNLHGAKPEVGRYDASYGTYLQGDGTGGFSVVPAKASGLRLEGEVRDIISLKYQGEELILVARNNDKLQVFK